MYQELNNISLIELDIDFIKFRKNLVNFYSRYNPSNAYSINLKHRANQLSDKLSGNHISMNTLWADDMSNLGYIKEHINAVDQSVQESEYNIYNQEVIDNYPYIVDCITKIEDYTNLKFGRIRLLTLGPRSVLPLHYDFGSVRYHLPIVTTDDTFFISDMNLCSMHHYDRLYKLACNTTHGAINLSFKIRLHLMMVSIDETNTINLTDHVSGSINRALQNIENADEVELIFNKAYYDRLRYLIKEIS